MKFSIETCHHIGLAGGVVRSDLQGGIDAGLTTPFDFPMYFTLRDVLLHEAPMTKLADVLRVIDKTTLEGCAAPISLLGEAHAGATERGARQLTLPPGASLLYWAGSADR